MSTFTGDVCGSLNNETLLKFATTEIVRRENELGRKMTDEEKLNLAIDVFLEQQKQDLRFS